MPRSGTWGDIRRYLGLSGLVEGILLALVGGSQACCSISYRAQESPPQQLHNPNVCSTKGEES